MPFQADAALIPFNHVSTALSAAVATLDMLSERLKAPFLEPILNVMQALLTAIQNVKRHQEDCAQMMEQIHQLLYAIIHVHIKSDTGGKLPPPMLNHLGKFTDRRKAKSSSFFTEGEMRVLLRDCQMGLEHAFEVFKECIRSKVSHFEAMWRKCRNNAEKTHEEVLEMISALSNVGTTDAGSTSLFPTDEQSPLQQVYHLALIITMRGAERPANVPWTRPFLEPFMPLTQDAARQTFIDIADDGHTFEEIDKILVLVDNMPLVIYLIAHLVDDEGFVCVLDRWEKERTSLLSDGYDRHSNLDLSISLSLESPQMLALPEAQELLSLLSILPDGLSDTDLVQSNLAINNVLARKLLRFRPHHVPPKRVIRVASMDPRAATVRHARSGSYRRRPVATCIGLPGGLHGW
ncbi:hypothetical protein FB451DRAFT_1372422 [Mycena latifolia]|nr:hypothetical protein FB451DRAFT_1372422 [Mycena latifolia]